ncbi:hypothetical protein M885DRAFT_420440, partial [Pelagophyceae sp. CCMP2097]
DRLDKLFVGNLAFSMTSAKLGDLFADVGFNVVGSKIVVDRGTDAAKGFGFVTFEDEATTRRAEEHFSGKQVDGRVLTV